VRKQGTQLSSDGDGVTGVLDSAPTHNNERRAGAWQVRTISQLPKSHDGCCLRLEGSYRMVPITGTD